MLDVDDYKKRVAKLYADERTRWRRVLEKGLPKNVKLDLPADKVLPFTQQEFGKWLYSQIQLQAIPCPYCRAPIDILSMELDHKTPLNRGGGPELANKQVICARCNGCKGAFTHEEYSLLVAFMEGPGIHFRKRLEGVLTMGKIGTMMRHFPRQKKGEKKKHTQEALYFSDEMGAF